MDGELKEAHPFIEQNVYSEYQTYLLSKDNADIKYRFVDNPNVYKFIDSVHNLPANNPITPFQTASDITDFLRNQWAGLFQRFLQEQKRRQEIRDLDKIKSVSGTLRELVKFVTVERKDDDNALQQVLLANHPVFHRFQELTGTPYRVFFTTEEELNRWLVAQNWLPVAERAYEEGSIREWFSNEYEQYIRLTEMIFDEESRLQLYTEDE